LDILYLLIPLSAVLVLVILGVFAWATHSGQFDDVEQEGRRILASGNDVIDGHQAGVTPGVKES
jgi:cbb3-type cytochrome oxidase maturation protein